MKIRNILGALLAAALPFHASAGTLFYVPIPATGSEAQSGMSSEKVYTSAIAAGNTKPAGRSVNGLAFEAMRGSGNSVTANGITLSAATGTLNNGGGKAESIQADGAMADLLSGMIFNEGAGDNSEQYVVLDPATLTAGKTYDLRVYVCNASGENRQVSLSFAGDGKPAVSTDVFNEDDATTSAGGFAEPNQVYYINYRFTWDGLSTPGFTATQKFGGTPFCLYALTNQETGGDADARPANAVVAVQPEPIAAAPRGSRTTSVDTTEDIGVSSDVFYSSQSLRRHGRWVTVAGYGRCWQPTDVDEDWRPYTRGRWVYSPEDGWVWDSDEDFGWATYHYGRWFREENSGWCWVPGRVWSPAWVSWRHGHSYVGWAPLPPAAIAAAGLGIGAWADHRWGIGPRAYNFVNARDFGAPSMARVLIPRQQNPGIMTNTNNVTNIVHGRRGIFNGGPNFQAVNNALIRSGSQPIPTVRVNRNPGTKPLTPDGKFSQLTAGVLAVTAPLVTKTKKPASLPPVVATIAAPKFDKGWSGLLDPKHAAALQAKIANETPGTAAKTEPARLPGTLSSTPGSVRPTTGPLKPFRPGKPGTAANTPGHPAPAGVIPRPGQPVKPTTAVTPTQPEKPVTPIAGTGKKRGKNSKPGATSVPQPGQPANPTATTPTQPGPVAGKPVTPATPPPEPVRGKKRVVPLPTPVPAPVTNPPQPGRAGKPVLPTTPPPAPVIHRKHTPPPAAPTTAPVKPATPPPAPVARPTPRPAPPVRPATPPPAPVAKPTPRPAPPVVVPVRPPPPAPVAVPPKPAAPVAPPGKGGKPTPTPEPGKKG